MRLLLLVAVLLPSLAFGQDEASEKLALEAKAAIDAHCSDAAQENTTQRANAVAEVSAVWARVSAELERSRKAYLLYWRGVLAQCLDQEEQAVTDLEAFVAARGNSELFQQQVQDSRRRLRRLNAEAPGSAGPNPGGVLAVTFGVAAGAAGGLAGWQWSVASDTADEIYGSVHSRGALQDLVDQGERADTASKVLVGTAAGLGVGTVVSAVVAASAGRSVAARAGTAPVFAVVPTQHGATAVIGGRW